jgi:hypothetical protein
MGIRTLHRRTAHAPAQADASVGADPLPLSPVPGCAPAASTARIPADLMTPLRHASAALRRRLSLREPDATGADPGRASRLRQWAELGRSYLALALTLLPRSRQVRTVTVFVASVGAFSEPPDGSARARPRPHPDPDRRGPGPDATP